MIFFFDDLNEFSFIFLSSTSATYTVTVVHTYLHYSCNTAAGMCCVEHSVKLITTFVYVRNVSEHKSSFTYNHSL